MLNGPCPTGQPCLTGRRCASRAVPDLAPRHAGRPGTARIAHVPNGPCPIRAVPAPCRAGPARLATYSVRAMRPLCFLFFLLLLYFFIFSFFTVLLLPIFLGAFGFGLGRGRAGRLLARSFWVSFPFLKKGNFFVAFFCSFEKKNHCLLRLFYAELAALFREFPYFIV